MESLKRKRVKLEYGVAQEFVNAESFSALTRKEGYAPKENRFHILPNTAKVGSALYHTEPEYIERYFFLTMADLRSSKGLRTSSSSNSEKS
ncbi:hypothetical protein MKX03_002801, partial [Papaver bracteatum]